MDINAAQLAEKQNLVSEPQNSSLIKQSTKKNVR